MSVLVVGAGPIGLGVLAGGLYRCGLRPRVLVRRSDAKLQESTLRRLSKVVVVGPSTGEELTCPIEVIDGHSETDRFAAYASSPMIVTAVGARKLPGVLEEAAQHAPSEAAVIACENLPASGHSAAGGVWLRAGRNLDDFATALCFDVASAEPTLEEARVVLHHRSGALLADKTPRSFERIFGPSMVFEEVGWFHIALLCKFMIQLHTYDGVNCLSGALGLTTVPSDPSHEVWDVIERSVGQVSVALIERYPQCCDYIRDITAKSIRMAKETAPFDDIARNCRNLEFKLGADERFVGPLIIARDHGLDASHARSVLDAVVRCITR